MAKGGRYLNTNKKEGKKGRGGKIVLIIVLVLLLLIGGVVAFLWATANNILDDIPKASVVEQNSDLSYDDLIAGLNGGSGAGTSTETPPETTEVPSTGATEGQ